MLPRAPLYVVTSLLRQGKLVPVASHHFIRFYVTPTKSRQTSISIPIEVSRPHIQDRYTTRSPLAILPLAVVLRTYLITSLSSSPLLLRTSTAFLRRIAESKSIFFSADRNPFLRWILKTTFYAQFCAGESKAEVQATLSQMKSMGYYGTLLEYALEVLESEGQDRNASTTPQDIEVWRKGMLDTVALVQPNDFVMLKWSGLGAEALQRLNARKPPSAAMQSAIIDVCDLAADRSVTLLPGAELSHTNRGLDAWTLNLQRKYNKRADGKAILYITYQCYLRAAPEHLACDLAAAQQGDFVLGVKLVRGAYLNSEPKHKLCSSKQETDQQYDAMVEAVLRRQWNDVLQPTSGDMNEPFPKVALMIASHNAESVQKAMLIRDAQLAAGEATVDCAYAQLQGMADDISCSLLQASRDITKVDNQIKDKPKVFKCATWGTLNECLQFLLRRAVENQEALNRTADTRRAMGGELRRRLRQTFGLT